MHDEGCEMIKSSKRGQSISCKCSMYKERRNAAKESDVLLLLVKDEGE